MRRSTVLKALANIALGTVLIVVVVIFSAAMLIQSAWFHRQLEERASKALGREVTIGDFAIDWFWPPRLVVDDLTIANAEWASEADFATIGHAEIVVAPFELLRGRLVVPELIVENPTVNLERSADNDVNWQMIEGNDDEQGEATIPIVRQLDITNASISYADTTSGDDFDAEVETLSLQNSSEGLEGSSEGTIDQMAYRLDLAAGSLEALNDDSEPYPLSAEFRFGQAAIEVSGTIAHPLETPEPQLTVSAEGEDLGELSALAMTGIPSTPGYELTGQVSGNAGTWRLDHFQAKLGRSDLSGTLAIDTRSDPLAIDGDLVANRVDLVEIREIFDVPPPAEALGDAAEDDGLIIPADAFDLSPLRTIDGRLSLDIKHLATPYLPIDDLVTELTIDGALLRAQPAEFGIGGGAVRIFLSAYGGKDPPGLDLLVYVRDVPVAQLFENTEFAREMGGKLDGQVALEGRGGTYRGLLGASDGNINLVMSGGKVSGLIIELIGLDVAEGLGLYLGDDVPVNIRCLVIDTPIEEGVVRPDTLLLDTPDTLIRGEGRFELASEMLELKLIPEPKDLSLLTFRSEIEIDGRLADIGVSPDLLSILEMLPPIDLGTAEDAPCDQLVERALAGTE